jgi:MAST domain-containing protein
MRRKMIIIGIFCMILLAGTANASNTYGKMDVYYKDELLPGKEIAKPVLKIGEPFTISINLTVYQKSEVSIELSEIEKGYFVILNGPTSKMNVYRADVMEKNSSRVYKWTVTPTEKWAGGSIPIDIVYQIDDFEKGNRLVNGGFTVAYCTISNEHYKGEIPTSKEQPVSETEPPSASASTSTSASTPAFTLIGAISVLSLVFALFRR